VCVLFTLKGYSQFTFGVSPGLNTNTAQFGYKMGKINPYIGFQYLGGYLKMEETESVKAKVTLLIPEIGVKFFAIENNKLKGYLNLNITKPFISGKYDGDDLPYLNDISLIGGNFGLGVEYFFDDNFSVGGEYGLQYIHGKYDDPNSDFVVNVGIVPTYSKICLNFYFGGGKSE
jgi:hypothetical protein